ncbi:ankyrin repeat domain-containing protein 50 [Coprinopsis cinerea okayama7|uniref:Ankyrin repeat domain-containing protein 50 n=1 Tax=Coprinopsis cinerea (strain Okayama-7 / 130 / ATCC MYA-4618 / FGSC 9003) TaxID=240176 RepID=A8NAI0_COPC7|nr:ankyrin repeat domain-containing protein 50 [Coprinopsis cinerea okayama7\|eukprot:XP_001831832.2 ankyrin repeat domain-containing protein 50 [Coprinopsis cinerea okayama7\
MATQPPRQQPVHRAMQFYGSTFRGNAVVSSGDVVVYQGLDEQGVQRMLQEERGREREEQQEELRKEIRDWFAPNVNFHAIQQENNSKWTDGTLSWFTDRADYQAWKNGAPRIIWGTGIPGAGKTILASRIISDLQQLQAASSMKTCVVFAYCRYSERLEVNDILESLVKQFLHTDPSLADLAEHLHKQHSESKTRPTQRELLDLLRQFENKFDVVFYVIDGLDEALVTAQFDLIQAVRSLRGQFALTSRPLKNLEDGLPSPKFYSVYARNSDVIILIDGKIALNSGFQRLLERHGYRDELVRQIVDKSRGMFLHAALQIEFVQHCPTLTQLKDALNGLPENLEDLYVQSMKRINEQKKPRADLANHVLLWLVFGREVLPFSDLQHALRLTLPNYDGEIHKDDLLTVCCGLVTVEAETDLVRLVHFTAQVSLTSVLKQFLPEPHHLLFKATTQRLIDCGIPSNAERFEGGYDLERGFLRHPLLKYSYDHWVYHARESMANPRYIDSVRQFVCKCTSFPARFDLSEEWLNPGVFVLLSPLHVVARYGLHQILGSVLMDTAKGNVALRTGGGRDLTALMVASAYGHAETVDALLGYSRRTALKSVLGGKGRPGTHLFKAQINLRDPYGWIALMYAAENGQEETVRRLLAHEETKVNITDNQGRTALNHAANGGHSGTVGRLLAHKDTDVNIADNKGSTALIHAAKEGHNNSVQRLLEHKNTDVNIADNEGRTALIHAAENGQEDAVRRLLAHKETKVNVTDNQGRTALIHAAARGRESAVECLLGHPGTKVNITDSEGWTALVHAAAWGHQGAIVRLLAHKDTDVNIVESNGRTALIHAAHMGRESTIERLLAHKSTNANAADRKGQTALIHALQWRREGAVERLLAHHGTDVNITDSEGRTTLILAVEWGFEGIVERLLAHKGINANAIDNRGRTALIHASQWRREGAVESLLAHHGTDVNIADSEGRTALILAVELGFEGIVERLLAHKNTDVNVRDNKGCTALIHAVKLGREDLVQHLILRTGTDINMPDRDGRTALIHAVKRGHAGIAELLVAHMAPMGVFAGNA